ncbi:MAG: hypothetical protein FJ024_00810 [Chloroflexi bacterium]|nr:hypothetical protein [Chloroflexota bacterium]
MGIDEDAFLKTMQAHLEASYECRWCFGIDGERVVGEAVDYQLFADLWLVQLCCPRCGGEFTQTFALFERSYLLERICIVYPQLETVVRQALKLEQDAAASEKAPSPLAPCAVVVEKVSIVDGTMAARVPNRLFPEYAREGYEEQTVLEMWFPGATR